MASNPPQAPLPLDQSKADLINVVESKEPWGEYKLEDGASIRVRPILLEVWKDRVQRDSNGYPIYHLNISPVITITPPENRADRRVKTKKKS